MRAAARTLPQLWRQACAAGGDRPALRHKRGGVWTTLTWREFELQVRRAAVALHRAGVQSGDVVAILSDNRPEWTVVDVAAQCLGAVSLGLYPGASRAQVQHALADAGARLVVVDAAEQQDKVEGAGTQVVVLDIDAASDAAGWNAWLATTADADAAWPAIESRIDAIAADAVALLLATAGTHEAPRLVAVTHAQLLARLQACARWTPLRSGEHLLSFTPWSQPSERTFMLAALLHHQALVHCPESCATVRNDLAEVQPPVLTAPPRFWERLQSGAELALRDAQAFSRAAYERALLHPQGTWERLVLGRVRASLGLARLRLAIAADAPLSAGTADWYAALGVRLYAGYSLAETAGFCAVQPTTAGEPFDTGLELDLSVDGEILVHGLAPGGGYWQQGSVRQLPRHARGGLPTGDCGVRGPHGVRAVGRLPALPAAVLPEAAEAALRASPYIDDAVVLLDQDRARPLLTLDEERLRHYAQQRDLPFTDFASLAAAPEIRQLLQAHVREALQSLAAPWRAADFDVLAAPDAGGDDAWTAAMRLNRRVLASRYRGLAEARA